MFSQKSQLGETNETIQQMNTMQILSEKRLVECLREMCDVHEDYVYETFDELLGLDSFMKILEMISRQYFRGRLSSEQFLNDLIGYFYHNFGVFIGSILSGRQWKRKMIMYLFYACVHSGQKVFFVSKIMGFSSEIQDLLVNEFEVIEEQMRNVGKGNELNEIIRMLQIENGQIKIYLKEFRQREQGYQIQIKRLNEEIQESKIEINAMLFEKRKILSRFKLSDLSEYEDLCMKLGYENEILVQREEQLLQSIEQLEEEMKLLKKGIHETDEVVVELNMKNSMLLKNREELVRQVSNYHENELNLTKQWGKQDNEEVITRDGSPLEERMSLRVSSILKPDIFGCSGFSNFSRKSKRQSRSSAWVEKDNEILSLSQKVQSSEQEIQQLKYKIMDLEDEIQKLQLRQKYHLKKIRKIQKLKDQFHEEYLSPKVLEI